MAIIPSPLPDLVQEQSTPAPWWTLYVDGASNSEGAGAGIVLISPEGHHLRSAIHFAFHATNNDAEYEALISGLKLALDEGGKYKHHE